MKKILFCICVLSFSVAVLSGCGAIVREPAPPMIQKESATVEKALQPRKKAILPDELPPLAEIQPSTAMEDEFPYEGKLFSFSARNTPLQDVLLALAKTAGLNLVLDKGVDPVESVSVEFKNLPLKIALGEVLVAHGYFYQIDDNVIKIKALETQFFHFNYPLLYNNASSSVGGNMLGGSGLNGSFSVETTSEEEQLDVWKQIKAVLKKGGGGDGGLLSEIGSAQVNPISGTIMVTDRRKNLELVESFLNRMEKAVKRQVIIEAKILEVTLSDGYEYGIDWAALQSGGNSGFSINSNLATNNGLFTIGAFNIDGDWSMSGFLDMLSTQGNLNVLSSPRLNVLNNQTALLAVGTTVPYLDYTVSTSTTTTGAVTSAVVPTVQKAQAGMTLGITPQISQDGVTTLHILPIITDLAGEEQFNYQGTDWTVPILDVRESDTIVQAPDGVTIVIGGIIQESTNDSVTKFPLLGDVPLLGKLFQKKSRANEKKELVLLLTPTIVER